nr:hypothetical protein [Micromonospora sp. DSM 115978]
QHGGDRLDESDFLSREMLGATSSAVRRRSSRPVHSHDGDRTVGTSNRHSQCHRAFDLPVILPLTGTGAGADDADSDRVRRVRDDDPDL